jgi:hypothetical protein
MPDAPSIDLSSVIREAVRQGVAGVHTCLPAVVVSYDPAKQTIHAQPVLRGRYTDDSGDVQTYLPPVLPNVPILFPSASGISITWTLTPGDPVWLMCGERSTDEWRGTGESDITPADFRRFSLADAVAIPGGLPSSIPAAGYSAGAIVVRGDSILLGSSGALQQYLLANAFLQQLALALPQIIAAPTALGLPFDQITALLTGATTSIAVGAPYLSTKIKGE